MTTNKVLQRYTWFLVRPSPKIKYLANVRSYRFCVTPVRLGGLPLQHLPYLFRVIELRCDTKADFDGIPRIPPLPYLDFCLNP